ncbi:GGDEF domain-containing protein [Desulfovibrio inopinatus]|uniref:GGDEF domain-containing protein n=1 Tax=Desulfovibrio inopinatus TaxID=102109 RepID=UPI00040B42F4|nr:GGDEF domain-containing protein [Desulfovibrio inopinatus]
MNNNFLRLLLNIYTVQKDEYRRWKIDRYADFYRVLPIGGIILVFSLWGWDWVIDSASAMDTLKIRLLMCLVFLLSFAVLFVKTTRTHFYSAVFFVVSLVELHLFILVLRSLRDGFIHGIPGFLYWYIFSPLACLFLPLGVVVVTMLILVLYPVILSYFMHLQGLDLPIYNTIIWPAVITTMFLSYVLDKLNQKLFLTSTENAMLRDYDTLTGVFNRRKLFDIANVLVGNCSVPDEKTSVAIFDIDDFKVINDRYGHLVGDRAIRHIIDIIRSLLRKTDVLGRFGGDEFIMILPGSSLREALNAIERIRNSIESTPLLLDESIKITISVGLTEYCDRDHTFDDAIVRADTALYKAKKLGKNKIILSD